MLPIDTMQAKNFACHQTSPKDTLVTLMQECKMSMNSEELFICKVEGAPEPMCLIGSEVTFTNFDSVVKLFKD